MSELAGKVAVVLGVGRNNIGFGIARRFIDAGASVVVAGRTGAVVETLGSELGVTAVKCDITQEEDLASLTDVAVRKHGRIQVAVNAVGMNLVKETGAVTRAELEAVTNVQFIGTFLFLKAMVNAMTDGGSIIQISSVTAKALMKDHAVYMATKAASDTLIRSVAFDYGPKGIRANSLSPGPTFDSPMAAAVMRNPAAVDEIRNRTPLRRVGTVADIANAAVWLASDACFVTGENIQVNGGIGLHKVR
jgi:NAD(P)-dependent dehydrogenase (short-subunit alcohol dehydrogenase family)